MARPLLAAIALAAAAPVVAAAAMQSSHYQIVTDSLNSGGQLSTSSSYSLEDTTGEQAIGDSSSTSYQMRAGYQQMGGSSIAISSPSDVSLGSLPGLGGGTAEATVTWTVTTDSSGGYGALVRADASPALEGSGGASFADYAPAGADPDYGFAYGSSESVFGFSPEGTDVAARFLDDGASCNAGSGETSDRCYDGFSTTDQLAGDRPTPNMPSGSDFTLRLKAGLGSAKIQDAGTYHATITVTVYAQ